MWNDSVGAGGTVFIAAVGERVRDVDDCVRNTDTDGGYVQDADGDRGRDAVGRTRLGCFGKNVIRNNERLRKNQIHCSVMKEFWLGDLGKEVNKISFSIETVFKKG